MSNIDRLYERIGKSVSLIGGYTEINELPFIIKSCRLKPYEFCQNPTNSTVLYREWIDEFGNCLKISDNKKIKIVYNDLSIDPEHIVCSDLYYGFTLDKVIKISKLGYFFFGKEDDCDFAFFTFLGIDNYLRSFVYLYDEIKQVSSLYLGMDNLKIIYSHLDIKYFLKIKNKKMAIPCQAGEAWLSCLPMSEEFNKILNQQPQTIVKYLKENK